MLSLCIMLTTRNRVSDLRRTFAVIESLNPAPDEVIVTLDGCEDDSLAYLQSLSSVPTIVLNQTCIGSVASRARMMQLTKCDLVLSLDDDSYPEQLDCISAIRSSFVEHSSLAVLTFHQRTDEYPLSIQPIRLRYKLDRVRSFPNSGACYRMNCYRLLPGFEPSFFHMYEEPDYALQAIANGWDVLLTHSLTIRHHYSGAGRSELRNHHLHARNEAWSTVIRAPILLLPTLLVVRLLSQFRFALFRGLPWIIKEPLWWRAAIAGFPTALANRRAVSLSGYFRWLFYDKPGPA
jgi:hypothetical protein